MDQRIYTKKQVDALLNGMERKAKRKIVAVTFLMFFICANSVFNTVKLVQLCADYQDELERIENSHADVVLNPMERSVEGAATDVAPVSTEGQAALAAPLENRITVTTYNAEIGQTDADPFTMANGERVYEGAIASNCYPFGTKLQLDGLGEFTVADRMNGRYTQDCGTEKERADIFRWSKEDNGMWENVELTVLS